MDMTHCFISYSWDSDSHKRWILALAERLHENGVYVHLDQWDIRPGADLTHYMESRIREADFVLLICTPAFAEKANSGRGGVGYEKSIVTGEIFAGAPRETKFIPVLRVGPPAASIPSYLKSRAFVDLSNDSKFEPGLEELLRHLHDNPVSIRPELGPKPDFQQRSAAGRKSPTKPVTKSVAAFDLAKFKELRDFAYRSEGLNLDEIAATKWAEARMQDGNTFDLQKLKDLRDYAYRAEGLNLDEIQALRWAEARLHDGDAFDLQKYKELRDYAYRSEGLNLNEVDAMRWADSRMLDGDTFDLEKFKDLRDYAYSANGLNLDERAAVSWAEARMRDT